MASEATAFRLGSRMLGLFLLVLGKMGNMMTETIRTDQKNDHNIGGSSLCHHPKQGSSRRLRRWQLPERSVSAIRY